jgi:hypothetical protein
MSILSDEEAKAAQQALQVASATGSWFSDLLGDLPKDLVGLIADRVKVRRAENVVRLVAAARERLRARGVEKPEEPNPKLLVPLLTAAADEDEAILQDLWARLLAAAMDPHRKGVVRQRFVETVKQLDPIDALVLRAIYENGGAAWNVSGRDVIASRLGCGVEEVVVSFANLDRLGCAGFTDNTGPRIQPYVSAYGKLLMNAVNG